MFGMDSDGPWTGKFLRFTMAGKTERIVVIGFDELGPAWPPMGVVTIKAENSRSKMTALFEIEPLLMLGFGMGLLISPISGFELVIVG